ncbi:metallophosphoesterase [Paraburkholderia bonniea]|uniref:metallophosphoesterase n=1 Tax=Paraburkholderia bonniea TaxID=2152891 RepID=UPI001290A028|nr:metallophosphoesterase [Paraburkholderia bonniea]WJF92029.1 metallophosphoesterase [Paraburkholderia bonniea]WJF95349.1 metallophosphoesterase [Paraburkholderia bonniea]
MPRPSLIFRVICIGILLHLYVGLRLVPYLPVGPVGHGLAVAWLALSCALIPVGMLARSIEQYRLGETFAWIGLLAMGFFSSLLILTAVRDLFLLGLKLTGIIWPHALDWSRWNATSAAFTLILALLVTALGLFNARRRARVVNVEVPLEHLPPELDGFTIVQISDIHVGPTIKHGYVDAIVNAVNQLEPDLIAITGDVIDGSVPRLARHTQPLAGLKARHGVFLVTGNHEYYSGADAWVTEFRRLGLTVLLNQHVVITHRGAQAVIAGVTDYSAGRFDPSQRSDPFAALAGAPGQISTKILLAHQPRSAKAAAEAGFTLQLSGHTHGGQFFPWNFFVRLQQPFTAGLARWDALWVYTSRGTGYWGPPKRLGAPSEITRIRLVPA